MDVVCRFDENKYVLKVYNDCYGGGPPTLNDEAKSYFNSMTGSEAERLLLTLEKFGCKASKRKYACFGVCLCPKECEGSFEVDEYDGLERPFIDHNKYLKHLISEHFKHSDNLSAIDYLKYVARSISVELECIDIIEEYGLPSQ